MISKRTEENERGGGRVGRTGTRTKDVPVRERKCFQGITHL